MFVVGQIRDSIVVTKADAVSLLCGIVGRAVVVGKSKAERRCPVAVGRSKPGRLLARELEVYLGSYVDMALVDSLLSEIPERRIERYGTKDVAIILLALVRLEIIGMLTVGWCI